MIQPIPINNPPKISIVLVPYNESKLFAKIINQIINRTNFYNYQIEIIVVDNSDKPEDIIQIKSVFDSITFEKKYLKTESNLFLAEAVNIAADMSQSDFLVYICSRHVYIYHPDWLKDLVTTMEHSSASGHYVMGGYLEPYNQGFAEYYKNTHVQGAIYIIYTKFIKENKYDLNVYKHIFMDTHYTKMLITNGYLPINVPSVYSICRNGISLEMHEEIKRTGKYKIAHTWELSAYE